MLTPYHALYFAAELTRQSGGDTIERLSRSLFDSCVDLNPHQIEAALFALRSPLSKGVILADEVGLGKTIEAGVVLCQLWAERRRKLLVICPAALRKQWALELSEKFNLPSLILETRSYKQTRKQGEENPFRAKNTVIICSYNFASRMKQQLRAVAWDRAVIDEAHKLRNVYRSSNKMGQDLKWALADTKKILLTATPLQNSLLELYGLSSLIDDSIFGDTASFKAQYANSSGDLPALKARLKPYLKRSLRSQVLEYVSYTERKAITRPFTPSQNEQQLYEAISSFLMRADTYAIPHRQRQLTSLILRKLLASSSFAVAGTLRTMRQRLQNLLDGLPPEDDAEFVEDLAEDNDWYFEDGEDEDVEVLLPPGYKERKEAQAKAAAQAEASARAEAENTAETNPRDYDRGKLSAEIEELSHYIEIADNIGTDSKSHALLKALEIGFEHMAQMGANKKALIFTESRRTQDYLKRFLDKNGYAGKIALFNGANNDAESKNIYEKWVKANGLNGRAAGSKAVDMRTALVEHFRDESEIMIATEAAAEGVNLQFCSLVINYDLPWNPQRVEQRIGRCHRYGQKHDVVVINFLNQKNAADIRVYELLEQKFRLFQGVFGASDDVLGTIESGVDFEKRILAIYESCRTAEEIEQAFNRLQADLNEAIQARMQDARQMLFENFDEDVHARLKMHLSDAKAQLDKVSRLFWLISKSVLAAYADFNDEDYSFILKTPPFAGVGLGTYYLIRKDRENIPGRFLYRLSHPLGEWVVNKALAQELPLCKLAFNISNHATKISMIEALKGQSGFLSLTRLTIDSLERSEELVFTAITDKGQALDTEICQKLFNCEGAVGETAHLAGAAAVQMKAEEKQRQNAALNRIMEHNNQFFREEHARLDKWAEDVLLSREKELKDLRGQIKTCGRAVQMAESVEEQASAQQKEAELVKKRRRLRHELDEMEDELEEKLRAMKAQLQARLKQRIEQKTLFAIHWEVV